MLTWQVMALQDIVVIGQADSILTTVYWIALVVGGGLLLVSTFAGGDADVDTDFDLDVDVDADVPHADIGDAHAGHAHGGTLATWFSTQFVVFFLAMFGVVGVVMTYTTEQSSTVTLFLALAGGLIIGQGAHQVMRAIKKTSGDSTPGERDYVNKLARVTIPINGHSTGQVRLRVGRSDRYIAARAKRKEDSFARDDEVAVTAYGNGVAQVVSLKEYEFINEGSESRVPRKEDS